MKSIYLLLLVTLPFILCQDYVVPDLDYDKTDPTCDNINSLIAATSADITRLNNYVTITLPERSSKLNDIYASVKKTCQIIQSKRPSLIQTTKLRVENVKTLEKLSSQVKFIAKSLDFGKESPKLARNLVQLSMNSVVSSDLCGDVFEATINLKNYLRFLIPAITETYIDGKLTDRLNRLQSFNTQCTAAACDTDEEEAANHHHEEEEEEEEEEAAHHHWEEEEEAYRHHEEEEAAWYRYEEEEEAYRHHEEEEAIYHHHEEEEAAWHHHVEEEEAAHRHWEEEEEAWHHYEEEEAAHRHWEEEEAAWRHHVEEEEAAHLHWEEEEAIYRHWEEEEAAWHHHVEEEEAAAAAVAAELATHGSDSTYTFYPTYDSNGGTITLLQGYSVKKLKDWCTANSNCLGFNDNGEMKSKIKTKDEWNQWTTDPTKGFYLKKSTPVDYYLFYPNQDSTDNDMTSITQHSISDLKTECSARPACKGFNSNGDLKKLLKPQNQWSSMSLYTNWGFYVRLSDFPVKHDYTTYMNLDSTGNDIIRVQGVSVADLKAYCDYNSACAGFTTDGYIKSVVKPQSQLTKNTNSVNWALYVKGDVSAKQYNTESNYAFYPNLDTLSNNIVQLKGYTMEALKDECDKRSNCAGFNTDGYLRSVVKAQSQWSANNGVNWGSYVKQTTAPKVRDYTYYPYYIQYTGSNIVQIPKASVEDLKAACDLNSDCQGFSTYGWLKSGVRRTTTSQMSFSVNYSNSGFYVKN